jgi:hypothetical protein
MKQLKTLIEESFFTKYRTKTIKEGGVHDLEYLKDLLKRLKVTKKSGSFAEEDTNNYSGKRAIGMPLYNGEIEANLSKITGYNPNQKDEDRLYQLKELSFSLTRHKGKEALNLSFSWQNKGEYEVYNQCQIYLEGTLTDIVQTKH